MNAEDITGKTFGYLTALKPLDERTKTEGRNWLWQCVCGRQVILPVQRVRQGRTKSCGCLSRKTTQSQRADITGLRFGRLTAIAPTEQRSRGEVVWEFRCDCGNTVTRPQNLVSSGKCRSCGCLGRENQKKMYENKFSHNHVMGTNLAIISSSEDALSKYNKTGVKGVLYDRSRDCYVAHIGFQGEHFRFRTPSISEAIILRKELKKIHKTFLAWWDALSDEEKEEMALLYKTEKNARAAIFRAWIEKWKQLHPEFFPKPPEDKNDGGIPPQPAA